MNKRANTSAALRANHRLCKITKLYLKSVLIELSAVTNGDGIDESVKALGLSILQDMIAMLC